MTVEEIKNTYTMREIVERYGFHPNRAGFICCPFHQGDREPSLKVYEKDFYCHACGASGDIFTFVQKMEGMSFQSVFKSLGGSYQKPTFSSGLALYRARKRKEMQKKEEIRRQEEKRFHGQLISIFRDAFEAAVPFSDAWVDNYNALQYQLYVHSELNGLEARW
ncbi:MAG: CHC2 zinc finger domain-containing protein [bacterium]|nr:CHC2 zinc finger domain-containing protein [bacterium]